MKYFLNFIDDFLIFIFVYLIKVNDKAFEKFNEFKAVAECQTGQ